MVMEPKYYAYQNGCLRLVCEYPLTSLVNESLLIIELEIVGVPFFAIIDERE